MGGGKLASSKSYRGSISAFVHYHRLAYTILEAQRHTHRAWCVVRELNPDAHARVIQNPLDAHTMFESKRAL